MKIYRFYSNPTQSNRVSVVGKVVNNTFHIAVARCSKKDIFIRKKGRAIAEGRLKKGKLYTRLSITSKSSFVAIAQAIVTTIENDPIHRTVRLEL